MQNIINIIFSRLNIYGIIVVTGVGASLLVAVGLLDGELNSTEISNVLTLLLASSAFLSVLVSNNGLRKQLKVEQQPMVVITKPIIVEELLSSQPAKLVIKNIGRGPALNVMISMLPDRQVEILAKNQPLSVDLAAADTRDDLAIKQDLLPQSIQEGQRYAVYINFQDQLGNSYQNQCLLQHEHGYLKVVKNSLHT